MGEEIRTEDWWFQWSFLVPLIGGRYHIIPQLYWQYIPLIYHLYIAYWVIIYHLPPLREPETAIDGLLWVVEVVAGGLLVGG